MRPPSQPLVIVRHLTATTHATPSGLCGPAVKLLLLNYGLALEKSKIPSTGPKGNILKSDVVQYVNKEKLKPVSHKAELIKTAASGQKPASQPSSSPSPARPPLSGAFAAKPTPIDVPLTNMRKTIAKRLTESKSAIPHYYLTSEIEINGLLEIREQLNKLLAQGPKDQVTKISINDFIIKASALACLRVAETNSFWMESFIRQNGKVDVSVAVSTPTGLITPIVKNAHDKGLEAIAREVQGLAKKARDGKLQPHEFQGGTFTISNLGMFGSISDFTAIINPPQSCILAIGGAQSKLVPDKEKGYRTTKVMEVTLSCDHRTVDGAVGALWLRHIKDFLENPHSMLQGKMLATRFVTSSFLQKASFLSPSSPRFLRNAHFLAGVPLKRRGVDGLLKTEDFEKKVIVLYFSAGWCGQCKRLTPKVKKFYDAVREKEKDFEVIWISGDKEAEHQKSYYDDNQLDWAYIPFGDAHIQSFAEKFKAPILPVLKLVNDNGDIVHDRVRADIESAIKADPLKTYKEWKDKLGYE
ncbi:hypothetical protein WR25_06446 [Diploscapter pachys]|uniref:Thioredoxin domain-containing protein n=1 Tax=Diploscapter pachys TaxID=2018661 RepID=A0A2A2K8Z1_9BILA|nr:hypothetical protein WR25_06446 [Diploscapter pachys]